MAEKRTRVNAEREYVVKPLINWFKKQKTNWDLYLPENATAQTGWDLEARRKNLDLLVEAKYVTGPFITSFSRLVTSPLTNRAQHFMKIKSKSWCANVCWAIGSNYITRNVYQLILDYFVRNPSFWKHYCEDLNVKYIFFVKDDKVARIPFKRLLDIAEIYDEEATGKGRNERREIAGKLMNKCIYR